MRCYRSSSANRIESALVVSCPGATKIGTQHTRSRWSLVAAETDMSTRASFGVDLGLLAVATVTASFASTCITTRRIIKKEHHIYGGCRVCLNTAWTDRADEVEDDGELLLRLLQVLHEALPRPCLLGGLLRGLLRLLGVPLYDPGEVDAADRGQPLLLAARVPAAATRTSVSRRFGSGEAEGG